jgi:hypothetical protein
MLKPARERSIPWPSTRTLPRPSLLVKCCKIYMLKYNFIPPAPLPFQENYRLLCANCHETHSNQQYYMQSSRYLTRFVCWYYRESIPYPKRLGPELSRISDFFGFWNTCILEWDSMGMGTKYTCEIRLCFMLSSWIHKFYLWYKNKLNTEFN